MLRAVGVERGSDGRLEDAGTGEGLRLNHTPDFGREVEELCYC